MANITELRKNPHLHNKSGKRLYLLDSFRGLAFVNMVIYHAMFNLTHQFGYTLLSKNLDFFYQQSICISFIIISGISLNLSKRVLRNGLYTIAAAFAVSLSTYIATPQFFVSFGILHFFGVSLLIAALLKKRLEKLNPLPLMIICLVFFLVMYSLPRSYLGIYTLKIIALPGILYNTNFLFFLGLPNSTYSSGDYFPLLPWVFLFFFGFFLWRLIGLNEKILKFFKHNIPFLSFLGRHTLIGYLLHQPILYGGMTALHYLGLL